VGCNFWQTLGSHFTAKSNNGTHAQTKTIFFVPPWSHQHSTDAKRQDTGSNEELIIFSVFSLLVWSPTAQKRLDATFGSRRGAILQQNPTTAHLAKLKLFFSFRNGALNIVLTHSVRVRAATRNNYSSSDFSLLIWSPTARYRWDATSGSRWGAILQQNPTTAHMPKLKLFFSFRHGVLSIVLTQSVRVRVATWNK
jgi:hypothetical protein